MQAEQILRLEQENADRLQALERRLKAEFEVERRQLVGPSITEWVGSALLAIPSTAVKGVAGLAHQKLTQHWGLKELQSRRAGELKLAAYLTGNLERVARCVLNWNRNLLRELRLAAKAAVAEKVEAEEFAARKTQLAHQAWDQLDEIVAESRHAVNQIMTVLPAEMRPTPEEMRMETPEDVVAGLKGVCTACRFYMLRNKKKLESADAVDAMLAKISQDYHDSQISHARLHVEMNKKDARHKAEIERVHAGLVEASLHDNPNVSQDLLAEIRNRLEEILHDVQPLSPIEKIPVWGIQMGAPPAAF